MQHRHRASRSLVLVLVLAVLSGCSASAASTSRNDEVSTAGTGLEIEVRSFAVVGDSLTAGGTPIRGPEVTGRSSWVPATVGPGVEFRGGWATDGATTADMSAGVTPVDADVLVVMGGTNDLIQGVPWQQTRADLLAVATRAGARSVLLSAVPPYDRDPTGSMVLNWSLAVLAAEQGWAYTDPWEPVADDGSYRSGATLDGVHPTPRVAAEAGERLRAALLAV